MEDTNVNDKNPIVATTSEAGKTPHHDKRGKFKAGNKASTGSHPWVSEINKLRAEIYRSVKLEDIRDIVKTLVEASKTSGGVKHATLLLGYLIGKPEQHIEANVTTSVLTPEQVQEGIDNILGIEKPKA